MKIIRKGETNKSSVMFLEKERKKENGELN